MHIAVVGSLESWYARDLIRAAGADHRVTPVTFREMRSRVDNDGLCVASGEVDLRAVDAVLARTMPPGSLEQVILRMDMLGGLARDGQLVVNSPRAIEAAVDKYLAMMRLAEAGLIVPRTIVCQTVEDAMAAFAELDGDVVLKPPFGAEGRGIARLDDEAVARRTFSLLVQLGAVFYLQPFIEHEGSDLRLLVIGERVLGMRRTNPLDWRTNVSRGARAEPLEVTGELSRIAQQAASAVGAELAGVDLLPGKDGRLYALEVNAVPGWKALAKTLDVDVARLVIDYLVARSRDSSS